MFQLIKQAHVYAPTDLGVKDILLCNDHIIDIQDEISFSHEDMEVIEAKGKYVVPGFIDQHVHVIGGGGEDGFSSTIREIQMSDCVRYGVTTVIGLLGTDDKVKSIEALVGKTKALREQGISAYCLTGSYAYPSTTLTGDVGKDIAFIDEIIGVKIALADHRSSHITKEELTRLASQARTAGLLAKKAGVVHIHTGKGKNGYHDLLEIIDETDLPVTQFRPTHIENQYNDALEFADRGGYIDFTADGLIGFTADRIAKTIGRVPLKQITLSSDANGSFPIWSKEKTIQGMGIGKMETLYQTVKKMITACNVPMEDAISIITKNVADALLLSNKGEIGKGKDADLVLLDEDYEIDTVIALGKVMVKEKQVVCKDYYDYDA